MADHPVKVPPELVASLRNSAPHGIRDAGVTRELWLINSAYAAGADQELEACCEWLRNDGWSGSVSRLHAARRPKPPTLAEQALDQYERIEDVLRHQNVIPARCIRAALERLAELEAQQ